ncbi:MAG: TatD family hydrolase [Flavobacteriales bacterium]|jgi:TatD DNase family protein|nr:TatD family hydrolase [Flavobacteriales bacterium]
MLIDTHTHLYASKFDEDRDEVIQDCIAKGVEKLLLPNIDSTSTDSMLALAAKFPGICMPMMGIHPCSINNDTIDKELAHAKAYLFSDRKFIAVGEIGIDLYWDKTTLDAQVKAFKTQIEWAKELNLPIAIHARDSFDEIFEVLDEVNDDKLNGVLHCFTGNVDQAKHIINYGGFKLGIGGVVTFKNGGLDKVLKEIELEHLILETDAPYLAPTPYRGKRNSSQYIPLIGDKLADIYNCTLPDIAKVTTRNAVELFGL